MYSTILLLLLMAFYLLYNLSDRVKATEGVALLNQWRRHRGLSYLVSLALIGVAAVLCIYGLGFGAGIFGCMLGIMGTGSLVVTLAPFRYFRITHLLVFYLFLMAVELVIF